MNELPLLARRSMAIFMLIAGLLSCWNFVISPLLLAASQAVEDLDNARFELHRLVMLAEDAMTTPDAIGAELDLLRGELFAMRSASDTDAHFVAAIDQLIRIAGVRLIQLKAVEPSQSGVLTRYTVDVNAAGSENDIARLLSGIEQHQPLLIIDQATLLSHGNPLDEGGFDTAPEITLELRLSGFAADIGDIDGPGSEYAR